MTKDQIEKLVPGVIVHIDTDTTEWGRLACDAVLESIWPGRALVTTLDHRRTGVLVPFTDIAKKTKRTA